MAIKHVFLYLFFLSLKTTALCQHAGLIKMNKLEERIHRGGDTTYVVNFWATWCAPCIKELPEFEKLNKVYKRNLKVILVSLDFKSELEQSVLPFVRRKKLKSEVWLLDEDDQQKLIDRIDAGWSGALPATLFIKGSKRHFFERSFTLPELVKEYKKIQ